MEVRLLGGLRRRLGTAQLSLAAGAVRELLWALVERGGSDLAASLFGDPEAPRPEAHRDLRVLVNGRSVQFLDGLDTALRDGDAVTVHMSGARGYPGG